MQEVLVGGTLPGRGVVICELRGLPQLPFSGTMEPPPGFVPKPTLFLQSPSKKVLCITVGLKIQSGGMGVSSKREETSLCSEQDTV